MNENFNEKRLIILALMLWVLILLVAIFGDAHSPKPTPSNATGPAVVVKAKAKPKPKTVAARKRTPHAVSRSKVRAFTGIKAHTPGMRYAQNILSAGQYACLSLLWNRESGWSPRSRTGSHFGIAQLHGETSTDAQTQIDHGLRYIANRYGSPCSAWSHSLNTGWY